MNKKLIMIGIAILYLMLISISGCIDDYGCGPEGLRVSSIHEWGIFEQSYNNTTIIFSGPNPNNFPRPPIVEICAEKPAIYFHGHGQGNISLAIYTNATNIVTIPEAEMEKNKFTWNIDLATNESDNDLLNPVDTNNKAYDYLFYEGKDIRNQDITSNVTVNSTKIKFNITNIGNSTLTNVFFWYHPGNINTEFYLAYIPSIQPDEKYTVLKELDSAVTINETRARLETKLTNKKLTEQESEDLLNYWVDGEKDSLGKKTDLPWFQNRDNEYAQVIYFIDQSEYDKLLPIEVDSNIQEIIRVGIVSVRDIPIFKID